MARRATNKGEAVREIGPGETVKAGPTKNFFVAMLTRDISLDDSILDLLDNCIDGVVRSLGNRPQGEEAYDGFEARIEMNTKRFTIRDNCGGIPLEIAREKAFMMGRPPADAEGLPTIGMYGIGMKRAIFKLGRSCQVHSHHDGIGFVVTISPDWMNDQNDWDLPIAAETGTISNGTLIVVDRLNDEVARRFDEQNDDFIEQFRKYVSEYYSLIISKGFSVFVNGKRVEARPFRLLSVDPAAAATSDRMLAPYVFKATVDGVVVEIYAGLYRELSGEDEEEDDLETRGTRDDAGWTIACNDRVVVYRDRTRLTGWGEAGVPSYHNQFIGITGIVFMYAADPWKLPLTTTKRGLDASSEVYLIVKEYMREATRHFTTFTNRWKQHPRERERIYRESRGVDIAQLRVTSDGLKMSEVRKVPGGRQFKPPLPIPPQAGEVRVAFSKPRTEVQRVSRFIFGEPDRKPREVGSAAFERVLREARR